MFQQVERSEDVFSHPVEKSFGITVPPFIEKEHVVALRDKVRHCFSHLAANGYSSHRLIERVPHSRR